MTRKVTWPQRQLEIDRNGWKFGITCKISNVFLEENVYYTHDRRKTKADQQIIKVIYYEIAFFGSQAENQVIERQIKPDNL